MGSSVSPCVLTSRRDLVSFFQRQEVERQYKQDEDTAGGQVVSLGAQSRTRRVKEEVQGS